MSVVVCTRNRPTGSRSASRRWATAPPELRRGRRRQRAGRQLDPQACAAVRRPLRVEPRPGSTGRAIAASAAVAAPIVAYTDDDARPDREWLVAARARPSSRPTSRPRPASSRPDELETRAQLLFEDRLLGMGKGFEAQDFPRRAGGDRHTRHQALGVGCNMAFRPRRSRELGGFDPRSTRARPPAAAATSTRSSASSRAAAPSSTAGCRRPSHPPHHDARAPRAALRQRPRLRSVLCAGFLRAGPEPGRASSCGPGAGSCSGTAPHRAAGCCGARAAAAAAPARGAPRGARSPVYTLCRAHRGGARGRTHERRPRERRRVPHRGAPLAGRLRPLRAEARSPT